MPQHETPLAALAAMIQHKREVTALNKQIRRLVAERNRHDASIDRIAADLDGLWRELPSHPVLVAVNGFVVRLDADSVGNVEVTLMCSDYRPADVYTTHPALEAWPEQEAVA